MKNLHEIADHLQDRELFPEKIARAKKFLDGFTKSLKTVIIGDIHGRPIWKDIIEKENPDRVVFLGDYFDSFEIPRIFQINNFENIINFKIDNPQIEIILLIGNHDFHYFPEIGDQNMTGFQGHIVSIQIKNSINEHRGHLQMAYQFDDVVCTHAGISEVWLKEMYWEGEPIVEYVNDFWVYKPLAFTLVSGWNPYGDDTFQSPIWIRPRSLMKGAKPFKKKIIQVVGHTSVEKVDIKGKATGGRYYFMDSLQDKGLCQYLVHENSVFSLGTIIAG